MCQDRTVTGRTKIGQRAYASGLAAEERACEALVAAGWAVRARRLRTKLGEVDIVAERDGILAIVEVKARPTLADAAVALSARQQQRLIAAAELILGDHPDWGANGVRFDILLVDAESRVRRIVDAFRAEAVDSVTEP
jgi:putative endonuclease